MIQTVVVLMPDGDDAWPFEMVAGLPLVERNLMALRAVGVDCVHLLGDQDVLVPLAEYLSQRAGDQRLPEVCLDDRLERITVQIPGLTLVLDGKRVYHRELLRDAVSKQAEVSYLTPNGKQAGISVVSQRSLGNAIPFESLEAALIPDGTFSHPVESAGDRRAAERLIFGSLTKPTDGWFSLHLNRPISTRISGILARFPVHPNLITIFSLVLVGIPAGVFSALGTYLGFAVGGLLFQMHSILDGVDGEIARVKHLSSRSGQWLDTISDTLSNLLYLSGVTIGVYRALESDLLLWFGIAAVILHVVEVSSMFWHLETRSNSRSKMDFQWIFKRPGTRDKPLGRLLLALEPFTKQDLYSVLFMVLALTGMAWLILPAAMFSFIIILTVIYTQVALGYIRTRRLKRGSRRMVEEPPSS